MTGLVIIAAALGVVLAFGLYRRRADGRVHRVSSAAESPDAHVGPVTLLQFSSEFCAPCRRARTVLADIADGQDEVTHVEVDVAERLDLVHQHDITRTPTVLIVGADDTVHHRVVGELRPADFKRALTELLVPATVTG